MVSPSIAPELRVMSRNACPNSGPDWIYGDDCGSTEGSLTTFGYCGGCWANNRVPLTWSKRVDDYLAALIVQASA